MNLSFQYEKLKTFVLGNCLLTIEEKLDTNKEQKKLFLTEKTTKYYKDCVACCSKMLHKYNLLTDAFHITGFA